MLFFAKAEWFQLEKWAAIPSSPIDNIPLHVTGNGFYSISEILLIGFAIGLFYKLFEELISKANHVVNVVFFGSSKQRISLLKKWNCRKDSKNERKSVEKPHFESLGILQEKEMLSWIGDDWKESGRLVRLKSRTILAFLYSCEAAAFWWFIYSIILLLCDFC